jgi:hypothetical protein
MGFVEPGDAAGVSNGSDFVDGQVDLATGPLRSAWVRREAPSRGRPRAG